MNITGGATVFRVSNIEQALKYYTKVLGFQEEFRFGDYAGVENGKVQIHLSGYETGHQPVGSGHVYVFCDAVDDYYAEIVARGAKTISQPQEYPYGMRDFEAVDQDGNIVTFGAPTPE